MPAFACDLGSRGQYCDRISTDRSAPPLLLALVGEFFAMRKFDDMEHGGLVRKSRRESPARSEHTGDRPTPDGSLHRRFAPEFLIANPRLTFRLTHSKLSPQKFLIANGLRFFISVFRLSSPLHESQITSHGTAFPEGRGFIPAVKIKRRFATACAASLAQGLGSHH
jgi:hypothetical protein